MNQSRSYFGAVWGRSEEDENHKLLEQFMMKLNASYLRYRSEAPGTPQTRPDLARVEEILAKPVGTGPGDAGWKDAYEVEQLLVSVAPLEAVRVALVKNLSDADRLGVATAAVFRAEYDAIFPAPPAAQPAAAPTVDPATTLNAARALLIRLLDDVQWRFSQRYLLRTIANDYMFAMFWVFITIGIAFALVMYLFPLWPDLGFQGYPLALASGALGAGFSILISRGAVAEIKTIEALRGATQFSTVLLRLSVGAGAAAILYFLFNSGFLGEGVFPDARLIGFVPVGGEDLPAAKLLELQSCAGLRLEALGLGDGTGGACAAGQTFVPNTALRLMIVWCVIAGFSEKLVPTILASRSENANTG